MLEHPFLSGLVYQFDYNTLKGKPVNLFEFEFEQYQIDSSIIRDLILDEIILFNSKTAQKVVNHYK